MKKDWTLETKKRIGADFEMAGSMLLVQRAMASDRVRKLLNLSKTQLEKTVQQQDGWIRAKLTRLNVLESVLERRYLLGKLVDWLCSRLIERVKKPTMRPVSSPPPAKRELAKGEWNAVARETS